MGIDKAPFLIVLLFLLCSLCDIAASEDATTDLVSRARKEGKVVWYTTLTTPEAQKLAAIFEGRYPVKVEVLRTGSGALTNRVLNEHRAKRYSVDVIMGTGSRGGVPSLKKEGIITQYISPELKFIDKDLKDKDGYWTSIYQLTYVLGYNKRMVKSEDVPKTYDDLLKPIWKGKKISNDTENFVWFDALLRHWGKEKGLAYFRKLAQQDQVFQRGSTNRVQLVAAGEFPLGIGYGPGFQMEMNRGAPIDWVSLEPVVFFPLPLMIAKQAPHPAGARLLVDFLLSKGGQSELRDFGRIPSRSDVDPKPPRLFRGFQRIAFDIGGTTDMNEVTRLYNETFGLSR